MLFFSDTHWHKQLLRVLAITWSVAIVILCFIPANEVPNMKIPFADKWVHFIMFGMFSFLWLSSLQVFKLWHLMVVFLIAVIFGWLVEVLQGQLSFLGRSQDNMDTLADSFGGLLGVLIFYIGYSLSHKQARKKHL